MTLSILKDEELSTEVSNPIKEITPEIKELSINMSMTMAANNGIGIAAPQVGHLIRLIVIAPDSENCIIMINPQILYEEGVQENKEGCLSFPKKLTKVARAKKIRVKWLDTEGEEHEKDFEGIASACILHEIDHLQGITMFDDMGWKK